MQDYNHGPFGEQRSVIAYGDQREKETEGERGWKGGRGADRSATRFTGARTHTHRRSILETIASRIDRPARRVNDPPRALISAFERYRPRSVGGSFEFSHERISERTYRNTVHGGEYGMTNRCAEWPGPPPWCVRTHTSVHISVYRVFVLFSLRRRITPLFTQRLTPSILLPLSRLSPLPVHSRFSLASSIPSPFSLSLFCCFSVYLLRFSSSSEGFFLVALI